MPVRLHLLEKDLSWDTTCSMHTAQYTVSREYNIQFVEYNRQFVEYNRQFVEYKRQFVKGIIYSL